jgi:hypothetical protein
MLAWETNGKQLLPDHGYLVRIDCIAELLLLCSASQGLGPNWRRGACLEDEWAGAAA